MSKRWYTIHLELQCSLTKKCAKNVKLGIVLSLCGRAFAVLLKGFRFRFPAGTFSHPVSFYAELASDKWRIKYSQISSVISLLKIHYTLYYYCRHYLLLIIFILYLTIPVSCVHVFIICLFYSFRESISNCCYLDI